MEINDFTCTLFMLNALLLIFSNTRYTNQYIILFLLATYYASIHKVDCRPLIGQNQDIEEWIQTVQTQREIRSAIRNISVLTIKQIYLPSVFVSCNL
jgi:hypothetical protein